MPAQSGSVVHWTEVSTRQRRLLNAVPPALSNGPNVLQTPHVDASGLVQPKTESVSLLPSGAWASCAWPVQPVSRSTPEPSANVTTCDGQTTPGVTVGQGVGTPVGVAAQGGASGGLHSGGYVGFTAGTAIGSRQSSLYSVTHVTQSL